MLFDPDAQNVIKSVGINSTPYTFRVARDTVVAKAYLRSVDDYLNLLQAPHHGSEETSTETRNEHARLGE
jgi:hypothetical protein